MGCRYIGDYYNGYEERYTLDYIMIQAHTLGLDNEVFGVWHFGLRLKQASKIGFRVGSRAYGVD